MSMSEAEKQAIIAKQSAAMADLNRIGAAEAARIRARREALGLVKSPEEIAKLKAEAEFRAPAPRARPLPAGWQSVPAKGPDPIIPEGVRVRRSDEDFSSEEKFAGGGAVPTVFRPGKRPAAPTAAPVVVKRGKGEKPSPESLDRAATAFLRAAKQAAKAAPAPAKGERPAKAPAAEAAPAPEAIEGLMRYNSGLEVSMSFPAHSKAALKRAVNEALLMGSTAGYGQPWQVKLADGRVFTRAAALMAAGEADTKHAERMLDNDAREARRGKAAYHDKSVRESNHKWQPRAKQDRACFSHG